MKKIEVTKCKECPFISWEVDYEKDYIGAVCTLALNLKLDPPMSYGGTLISMGCNEEEEEEEITTPEWCPLIDNSYEISRKL